MSKGLFEVNRLFFERLNYSSDHGIFINNIILGGIADQNGRLVIGDRLVGVRSAVRKKDFFIG